MGELGGPPGANVSGKSMFPQHGHGMTLVGSDSLYENECLQLAQGYRRDFGSLLI